MPSWFPVNCRGNQAGRQQQVELNFLSGNGRKEKKKKKCKWKKKDGFTRSLKRLRERELNAGKII